MNARVNNTHVLRIFLILLAIASCVTLSWWRTSGEHEELTPTEIGNTPIVKKSFHRGKVNHDVSGPFRRLRERSTISNVNHSSAQRKRWLQNFPWEPTTDPNVRCSQAILETKASGIHHPVLANHGFLKAFFENEARFTPQFEQIYRLLEKHERANNPVVAGKVFQNLWDYHQARLHDPIAPRMHSSIPGTPPKPVMNLITNEPITWGERAELLKKSILYNLASPRRWPGVAALSEEEGYEMLDEILTTIHGMDQLPDPNFAYSADYEDELKLGDSPLVPYVGWQAAYDEWESERNQRRSTSQSQSQLGGIGLNNQLLDQNGNPLIAQE